ncbi:cation transport ATPase [Maritimibacter sp. UBA3975]|uniref:cation transport ATPase n=1 Tax=Maritimibacter sp. UBA3975 TaxID=1946833 RepID=UPI000C0A9D40|nr:cation transport ATPase [Maritimibacter sp. UBA3975]MAM63751.1 cation transport ATPase [Maritimibacter sp.]|tara:strand:+ start:20820 stop:21485 length:666 start_codon:yes stop_codon:yes gene_type:complete
MQRIYGVICVVALLAGCAGGLSSGGALRVLNGTFTLVAPSGFCPDPAQRRESPSGAFVLYGTCQGIEGRGPAPAAPAVLTAAVAPGAGALGRDDLAALAAHLSSDAGKAALARSGGSGRAQILSLERDANLILMRVRDDGTIDLSEDYWRAIFVQSGALVTITAAGTAQAPLAAATGKALTLAFVKAVREANPAGTAPDAGQDDTPRAASPGLRGLLNRLL